MERIVLKDYSHLGAVCSFLDFFALFAEKEKLCFSIPVFGSQACRIQFGGVRSSHLGGNLGSGSSGSFLLFCHGCFKAFLINGEALFLGNFIGQFPGEAIGIVQLEHLIPGKDSALLLLCIFQHFGKEIRACIEGGMETVFLYAGHFLNKGLLVHQFRIRRFHHVDDYVDHLADESVLNTQKLSETDSPAQDSAEHIAPAFIGRKDAVGNHIGNGSGMVGNYLQSHISLGALAIGHAGQSRGFFDNWEEKICFKIILFLLKHGSQTFKAGAGINILLSQRQVGAVFLAVILGENQVPDFQEAIAVATHLVFRVRAEFFALVVENFRVRAAGTFPDFPEVIGQRINMVFRQTDHLVPVIMGLMVIGINGDIQAGLVQFQNFRQEFPGPADGFFLEIVAKGEVPQHFKESMVAGCMAYVFNIAGADALLAGGDTMTRRFHLACKVRLQRRHACTD